jgi:hypothetical protein
MDLTLEKTSSANELQTILAHTTPRSLVSKHFSSYVALDLLFPVVALEVNPQVKHHIFSEAGI